MIEGFSFEANGRQYTCTIEERVTEPKGTWWWFVSPNDQHRYAPFQVSRDDTQQSVKERIVAYYENLLRRRAEPAPPRYTGRPGGPHRGKPGAPGAPGAPATAASPQATPPKP